MAAVMVKAYTDVAGEAAKKSAEAAAQLEIQRKALEDLQAQHRKNPPKDQVEALTYIHDEEDLQKQIADLEKVQEENEKLAEVSFDAAESQRILANEEAEKVNKERGELGTLIASGFIAGGALMGVVSALLRFAGFNPINEAWLSNPSSELLSLAAYLLLIAYFIMATRKKEKA